MKIAKLDFERSSHIGLFALATDKFVLLPDFMPEDIVEQFAEVLKVDPIPTRVAGTGLLGIFAAGNSNGIVLPYIARDDEVQNLRDHGIEVLVVKDRATAMGNMVAANDKGAVISETLRPETAREIAEFLGVDYEQMNVANVEIVGAAIVATNKGFLAHPNTSEEELKILERVFKVRGDTTTVNYGDPFVRGGIVANSHGIIVGDDTSPVEIMKIEDVLG